MNVEELYSLFDKKFSKCVLPQLNCILPKNEFSEPIWYIISRFHWRRFRAALPIIFAERYGEPINKILPVALASELIFAVALVQDDLIDGDEKRANISTSHTVFGTAHTIAAVDYVLVHIGKILDELRTQNIPKDILNKVIVCFAESQKKLYESFIQEKLNKGNSKLTQNEILDLYIKKTITGANALYCTALLCEKAPKNFAEDMLEYSKLLGIAGQIKNDIYDLVSWRKYPEARGYSDLRNGYMTYAIRKLLDKASEDEREIVKLALETESNTGNVLKLIEKYNIIEECIEDCKYFGEKAIEQIKGKYPEVEDVLLAWVEGNRRFTKL